MAIYLAGEDLWMPESDPQGKSSPVAKSMRMGGFGKLEDGRHKPLALDGTAALTWSKSCRERDAERGEGHLVDSFDTPRLAAARITNYPSGGGADETKALLGKITDLGEIDVLGA